MKHQNKSSHKFGILSIGLLCSASYIAGALSTPYLKELVNYTKEKFKAPTVSVVMSTYNREKSIKGAIDSILNQTMPDFEFIIVDDGSTDNTPNILEEYAKKDKRIIVLRNNKNMGIVAGLNKGLDKARGKYIARMDDDDISLPFRFERQVLAMEKNPHITLMGGGFGGLKSQKYTGEPVITDPDDQEIASYFRASLAHPTVIMRRDFLEKNNIRYDDKYLYAEDCGLYKKILENGGKLSALHESVLVFSYMDGLKKPERYIETQIESFKKVQKDKLKPFFDIPDELQGMWVGPVKQCQVLNKMVEVNAEKHILNQEALLRKQKRKCPKAGADAIFLDRGSWAAFAIVSEDGKTLSRLDVPTEIAKIMDRDENYVTVKWQNYPEYETFVKNNFDEFKYSKAIKNKNLKNAKIYKVVHPHWKDNLVFLKDNTFYRESIPDQTGKIVRQKNDILVLKWDAWPNKETFKKTNKTLEFLYDDTKK